MKHRTSLFISVAALAFSGLSTAALADTLDDNQVVRSTNGQIVRNAEFYTCVRTKWEAGQNACAPAEEQLDAEAYYAPPPRTVLKSAERTVYFDFDSSRLTREAQDILNSLATRLRAAKDIKSAQIVGYADRMGTASYNEQLSKRRAEAVKQYLGKQGYLNTSVAKVRALGEAHPVTACSASLPRGQEISCLSPDRRVEVEVHYLKTPQSPAAE